MASTRETRGDVRPEEVIELSLGELEEGVFPAVEAFVAANFASTAFSEVGA